MAITLKQRYQTEFNPKTGVFGTLYTKNTYSKDISGGGFSGQPFVKRPIPSLDNNPIGQYYSLATQALSLDFPIRGGSYEEIASREDFARIDRFFLYYPQGKAFTDKYRGLLRSNPKIETGREQSDSNTRIFPIGPPPFSVGSRNMIEQIASVGTGFHLPNAGSDILSLTEQEDLYGRIVAHKSQKSTEANRLVSLYNLHILPKPTEAFTKSREAQDSVRFLGIQPARGAIELINYDGGPNSLYGIGSTIIRKATDNLGAIINTEDAPDFVRFFTTNFKGEKKQGRDLTTNLNYQTYQAASIVARDLGIITDDEIGITTQGTDSSTIDNLPQQTTGSIRITNNTDEAQKFASTSRYDQLIKLGGSGSLTNAADYVPSTKITDFRTEVDSPDTIYSRDYTNIKIDKATRIGLGNPGARPSNKRQKVSEVYVGGQDKVNLTEINTKGSGNIGDFNSKVLERDSEEASVRDLIKFGFSVVGNSGGFKTLNFRALLTGYSDSHNAEWSSTRYAGRGENFYNYQGFDRQVNFNFKVAAQSKQEMGPLYRKLNYLVSSLYPDYSSQGFMQGNIVKLTIGDLFVQAPGILESINITVNDEYPWEIAMTEPEGTSDMKETPQILDCAVSFKPILTKLPALNKPIIMTSLYKTGGAGKGQESIKKEKNRPIANGNNDNSNFFAGGA